MPTATRSQLDPPTNCRRCPRLVAYRRGNKAAEPDWFNGAVPSFGSSRTARLLIVGLAPGLHGANKTGRVFTGDQSGELLFETLHAFGFLRGSYGGHAADGLELVDTMITNAVRCVPPANRPTAGEINTCRHYLSNTIDQLEQLKVVVALGRVAHDSVLTGAGLRKTDNKFAHGARHDLGGNRLLFDSYHCSRYNINTRRLTPAMFHAIFQSVRDAMQ